MSLQFEIEAQPVITLAQAQARVDAAPAEEAAALRQALDDARAAAGTRWFEEMELVREDTFWLHFGRDFDLWHEDEQIYSEGKQFLDAQQDYLDWLLPRCLSLSIGSSTYLLNHNIHTPEDWFYRANPAGFEHPNLS